jgi:hypothetical protein
VVELGREGDERKGEGGPAGFAEAQAQVEQRLEPEFCQYLVVRGFCRFVSSNEVVANCWLEAVGGQRGNADGEPVENDRALLGCGGEECADERGEFEAADAAEAFEWVVRIRCVDRDRSGHGCTFACEALRVEAGAAAADLLRGKPSESGEQGGRDR